MINPQTKTIIYDSEQERFFEKKQFQDKKKK